ncbi:MAG TPA: hypothetical protein DCL38_01045 [Lachnospiraceae bacterium]|nr:hypothetical protein [Lachnospiraceae bacterium]
MWPVSGNITEHTADSGLSGQRPVKKTNALFLGLILFSLALELFSSVLSLRYAEPSLTAALILSQGALIMPVLIFILVERPDLSEWTPFRKIKWSTLGLTVLFSMCISPFVVWINLLSQFFSTNFVAELTGDILSAPPVLLTLIIGFVGPFCEEFAFRGVIFHGLRKSGRILASILASGLFFGIMHMNLNQFSYAFFLGIAFAFLTEATGSLIPSLTVHVLINTGNIALEYIADYAYSLVNEGGAGLSELAAEAEVSGNELFYAAGIYMVPALIGLTLSIMLFISICRKEGSLEHILSLFKSSPGPEKAPKCPVITVSGWIAVSICVIVIIISDFSMRFFMDLL